MRRLLALGQLVGFAVALGAILAPGPRSIAENWPSMTIYPWWTLVLLLVGAAAALVSVSTPAGSDRVLVAAAAVSGVCAAQIGGLGLWTQKHWLPAFGFGGGFAGEIGELKRLAWVVAVAGILTALAALAQLITEGQWPRAVPAGPRLTRLIAGLAVLGGLPLLIAIGNPDLMDRTSLVALALVYGVPWGLSIAGAGWLSPHGPAAVLGACCLSASLSALAPSNELTYDASGAIFAGCAVVFGLLLFFELRRSRQTQATNARPSASAQAAGMAAPK